MVKKNVVMFVCVGLLLHSGSALSMGTIKRGYEWAKSKTTEKFQGMKNSVVQLRDAMKCIDTNSCTPKQQAYIKSLVKKIAVAVGAAAVACGIYVAAQSVSGKEAVQEIIEKFKVKAADGLDYVMSIARLTRDKSDEEVAKTYNSLVEDVGTIKLNALRAAKYMLELGYASGLKKEKTGPLLEKIKWAIKMKEHEPTVSEKAL